MIDRYSRKVMTDIWSDQKKYEIWYEIERYACEAQADLGVIPKEIIKTLDQNNAFIIRMNTEKIAYPKNTQYISRFAISIRDENAPECLAQIVKVAGEMKLTFRYETS